MNGQILPLNTARAFGRFLSAPTAEATPSCKRKLRIQMNLGLRPQALPEAARGYRFLERDRSK